MTCSGEASVATSQSVAVLPISVSRTAPPTRYREYPDERKGRESSFKGFGTGNIAIVSEYIR